MKKVITVGDPQNRLSSNNNCPFSVTKPILLLLCILIFVGIGISTIACDGVKKQSNHDHFKGMDMELPSDTIIRRDENNATIIFLKGKNLSKRLEKDKKFQELQLKNQFSEIALAFISANHLSFKIVDPANELTVKSVNVDDLGFKHVGFQQKFMGIPVWAAELKVHLDSLNHVCLMQGHYIPTPVEIGTCPALKKEDVKHIVADDLGSSGYQHSEWHPERIIYSDLQTEACLAYRVVVTLSVTEGWELIIDATTGVVLEKLPTVYNTGSPLMKIK